MAQLSINVSTHHGSTITVGRMISDDCLGFETTVYLQAPYEGAKPHVYARDTVFFHGNNLAIRDLLEKLLAAMDERDAVVFVDAIEGPRPALEAALPEVTA